MSSFILLFLCIHMKGVSQILTEKRHSDVITSINFNKNVFVLYIHIYMCYNYCKSNNKQSSIIKITKIVMTVHKQHLI